MKRGVLLTIGAAMGLALLAASAAPSLPPAGVDVAAIDPAVAPGDEFFNYSNGRWLEATEIPADRSSFGVAALLSELTDRQVSALIEAAAKGPAAAGSERRKVADYYAAYEDEAAIEARGLEALRPALARIEAIGTRAALSAALGKTLEADVDALNSTNFHTPNLFGLWVAADLDQPTRNTAFLLQGGLELPGADYYLGQTPRLQAIRESYRQHIATVFALAGIDDGARRARDVLELETALARHHESLEASEDVVRGDHHWTRADFEKQAPGLDWSAYFRAAGLASQRDFIAWQPKAIVAESALVASTPLEVWKSYLAFHLLERFAQYLPRAFVEERFAFYGTTLSGTPALAERWKRAVQATSADLGDAVGRLYVERYFPPQTKVAVEAMVRNIIAAFDRRIDALDWMDPATKATAKQKLRTLKVSVGYPVQWTDYTALAVDPKDALGNARRATEFRYHRALAKLNRPVDRDEWFMTPQTINAENMPVLNALIFPAARLQPPFYDPAAPAAYNYGSIGAVIGHEISHSFDTTGAQFDAQGRLRDWWTAADRAHFEAATRRLAQQFDAYRPVADLAVNGAQTLGENIADLAGLQASFDAYRLSLGGGSAPVVDGFTGDQQFFLGNSQSRRTKIRDAALRQQISRDVHAPAHYRVLTVRNLDAWYDAFAVEPGQALYLPPAERVRIW